MAKLAEELWKTLQEITDDEFNKFKWFLKQDDILEGFPGIAAAQLQKAKREDAVDLMVQKHQGPGALRVTLTVLEKISRNDLVQSLKENKNLPSVALQSDYEREKAELEDKIKMMIQERLLKIQELQHSAALSSKSADRHIADCERAFSVLQQFLKKSLADLIKTINERWKSTQKQANGFIEALEGEISELRKSNKKMEQLSCAEDQLQFPKKDWTQVTIRPPPYGGSVETAVNELERKFSKEKEKLIAKAKLNRVQEFARDVTLDPDTAHPFLVLSDDGKQVHCGIVERNLPDTPQRFNTARNVLGKQSFSSGRFYFEVQVEGMTSWDLGVVKESIDRKGSITARPESGFWSICLRNGSKYKSSAVHLSVKHPLRKVGVFVDYEKRSVIFYDVDSADCIHRFDSCCFTEEKLYPFFSPSRGDGSKNPTPLIISPVQYND